MLAASLILSSPAVLRAQVTPAYQVATWLIFKVAATTIALKISQEERAVETRTIEKR